MTELLSPAGNMDKLKTAVRYGAAAVYLSGYKYGLRSGSDNFDDFELGKAVDYAHEKQRRVYCTLNAFLQDTDFNDFTRYIKYLEHIGIDAVIVSDIGVAAIVSNETNLKIHVSTQASVLNTHHAEAWKKMGAKRIVLGREISLNEAISIKNNTGLEIELFVHGAMCMSYSGHCTISNYMAGRDSNRGGCIQSCRHRYSKDLNDFQTSDYIMSSKDLNSFIHVEKLFNYRVDSLKIEGRMKSLLYVATVTQAYGQILDYLKQKKEPEIPKLSAELTKLPYRDYCDGSYIENANWDSVYRNHNPLKDEYRMAGYILENTGSDGSVFYATSKIQAGEPVEFIGEQDMEPFMLNDMTDVSGNPVQQLRPNQLYLLKTKLAPNTVARFKHSIGKVSSPIISNQINLCEETA